MPRSPRRPRYSAPYLILLAIALTALTSWATFTGYTAKQNKPSPSNHSEPLADGDSSSTRARLSQAYGNIPLSFEANRGQTEASVKYLARGPGYNIFLTATETVLVFPGPGNISKPAAGELESSGDPLHSGPQSFAGTSEHGKAAKANPTVIRMRFDGANANARAVEGIDQQPGNANYFAGNDSSGWLTDVPTYRKIAYRDAYPGIDVVYYGNRQQLEYDLVVAPGADPGVVALDYDGVKDLRIDHEGNLLLQTPAGAIRQQKPLVYQEINGKRTLVDGRYVIRSNQKIGFRVAKYDRSQPLVIDPVLAYSSLVNSDGHGFAVAVDSDGYAYITGHVATANFNPTAGAYQLAYGGGQVDVFVTKIQQNGNNVVYSTYLGGNGDEEAYGIAVDASGNTYITGYASGNFPTTGGAYQTVLGSGFDCFVTKLNATGSALVYSTFYGGNDFDEGSGIAVDAAGNAYVTGDSRSSNLVTTAGAPQPTSGGGQEAFVLRLNPTGSALSYATYLGGGGFDLGIGIAVDSANNAYVAGQTSSLNLPQVNSLQGPGGIDRGVFRSTNNGASWSLSSTGLTTSYVYSMAIDRNTPTTMYAGTVGGVSKSIDGGLNWTTTGPTNATVFALAIDPSNSSIVYAGTISGAYKTTNGGGSWTLITNGMVNTNPNGTASFPPAIRAIAIDPNTPATVYAGGGVGMFKSTNGGASWTSSASGLPSQNVRAVVIDPVTPSTLYVGLNANGIFKSTNSGANWTAANSGLANLGVRSIAIVPNAPATLYAGTLNGVFKTTTSGTSWSAVNNGFLIPYTDNVPRLLASVNAIAIDPVTPANLYAATTNTGFANGTSPLTAVMKSTDGGANWTAVTSGFNGLNNGFLSLAINPVNPAQVFAGNNGDSDGFAAKINANGNGLIYSTYVGSGRGDYAIGIAADLAGNSYICGLVGGTNFPVTPGAFRTTLSGGNDTFVMKLDDAGTSRLYSTLLGGSSTEDSFGIAIDSAGSAYVIGTTLSTDFPVTSGAFQTIIGNRGNTANLDAFVTKLNPTGTAPVYSSYLGGAGNELAGFFDFQGNNIAVDPLGNAYVVGSTSDGNTFPSFGEANGFSQTAGPSQTFVAKIDSNSASYSITGRVTTAANAPIAGVFVKASNGQGLLRSTFTDSQGFYSIVSLVAGDYTVTPDRFDGSGKHYLYSPATRTFAGLNSDQTANFTATQVYDIQSQVTSSTVPGLGIFDVTVTLSGSAAAATITDVNGNYTFQDLLPGNYVVTPSKTSFTFTPVNLVINALSADLTSANFTTASTTFFTVSGRVADGGNVGISNVLIGMVSAPQRGTGALTTQTDGSGNYSFPNLQAGGNYAFTATKPGLAFTPQSPTLNNLSANQTLNFTAAQPAGLVGKIAYVKDFSSVAVMNADGSGDQNIFAGTNPCDDTPGISWSPDGKKIAFSACAPELNLELYTMNADGTGIQRVTTAPLQDVIPSWSPDGTRLTFSWGECSGTDAFPPEVFTINASGTGRTRLTNNFVFDAFSDWSPGGSTIAFVRGASGECSNAEETGDIYAMNPDGSNLRTLASTSDGESRPAYSPDGFKIAYFRGTVSGPASLYVMNADGTGQTRIATNLEIDDSGRPSWSPDGSKIAFSAFLPGVIPPTPQIFVINADGTGLSQITASDATSRMSPAWQHYSISGHVTGNPTSLPLTIALAGTLTRVTQTDANGNYVFGNLTPGGNYTVSPVSNYFGVNPAKTDINNLVGNQIANFTVLPQVIPTATPPLTDDFGGAQRDPAKWNLGTQTQPLGAFDPQVPVVHQNGQLVITPRTQTDGLHYNGYVSLNSFDFNNAKASVEVVQTAASGADTIFAIGSDLENFSRFVVRAGDGVPGLAKATKRPRDANVAQLIFQVKAGGQLTSVSIPYDPVAHRFMRFRHQPPNNSIAFETSPNNVDFVVQREVILEKGVSALTTELSAGTTSPTNPGQAVFDNFNLVTSTFQFSASGYSKTEAGLSTNITVTRTGDTSGAASVNLRAENNSYVPCNTFNGLAVQNCDCILSSGTLNFLPGQTSKSFPVIIIDDLYVEGDETLTLLLLNSSGSGLNSPGRAILTLVENDTVPATTNPLDGPQFYVRQHYYDFLGRLPDDEGLAYWTNEITQCGSDQTCVNNKRVDVSNAFFYEQEYQQTASYVFLLYRAAYGNDQPFPNPDFFDPNLSDALHAEAKKLPRYLSFARDRAQVVGGANLAQTQLALANALVLRPEFISKYPLNLSNTQFVAAVLATIQSAAGVDLSSQSGALVTHYNNGGRGLVMFHLANDYWNGCNRLPGSPAAPCVPSGFGAAVDNRPFIDAEYNRSFVYSQYSGYLRRDGDINGFIFWLNEVSKAPPRNVSKQHAMVCSFMTSAEYQFRLSPVATHNNGECTSP